MSADDGYLDAARACLLDLGWRRTTLTEIARRAGVSRMTIYRRWPDMDALLADLLVRELSGLLADSGLDDDSGDARERLARWVTGMVVQLQENPLVRRIVELDPDLLHPYLFSRLGRNQLWMLDLLVTLLREGQAEGSIRTGDPDLLARSLLLTCTGHALSSRTMTTATVTPALLHDQLVDQIERYLRP